MSYSTLLFDADGTLLDFDRAERDALTEASRAFGVEVGDREFDTYRSINMDLWRRFEHGEIDTTSLKRERFARYAEACGIAADPDDLSSRYLGSLKLQGALLPGALEILDRFASRTMVLITNGFSEVQRSRLAVAGIADRFDAIVISEEVGVQKPDPRIFEIAADAVAAAGGVTQRDAMLMIGDSPTSDIRGGIRFGIDTCLIGPAREPVPPDVRPTHTIEGLDELPAIVET